MKRAVDSSKRVCSGISNFDKLIDRGFVKSSTNLIVGGTGSGKTIFSTQFLIEGCKKGETCLYISFEERKNEFYENMKVLGLDLEELERKGKFFFIEYAPQKVKTMLEEGGGIIESLVLRKNISRIVMDSLTSFVLLFENETEGREAVISLLNILRKWDATSILTYARDPAEKKTTSRILEFESDSVTYLYFSRNKSQRQRFLEVLKMRGTAHSTKTHLFSIGKKGIEVSKNAFSGGLGDG